MPGTRWSTLYDSANSTKLIQKQNTLPFPQSNIPDQDEFEVQKAPKPSKNRLSAKDIIKHSALFILTFISVTYVGIMWVGQSAGVESYFEMWPQGMLFAVLLLAFLATHEFGHYFAAVYHNIRVSLPYFIPIPIGIGTMGAVISIRERIKTTTKLFDVGISGPIAGFIVSLFILIYGFATLPDPTFMENFAEHDEIIAHIHETGSFPDEPIIPEGQEMGVIVLGDTMLYSFLASFFDDVPPMHEMYHYPFLFAGWLGLFFTALNLMPIGQLDGGHILYSLVGYERHKMIARVCFGGLTLLAGIEAIPFLHQQIIEFLPNYPMASTVIWALVLFFLLKKAFKNSYDWIGPVWALSLIGSVGYLLISGDGFEQIGSLIWVFWCFFLAYFVKMEHPPVVYKEPLSPTRRYLGWISMIVFVLCISPSPINIIQ